VLATGARQCDLGGEVNAKVSRECPCSLYSN